MKLFVPLSAFILVTCTGLFSCKKPAPKQTKHIPKNVAFVAGINTRSLYDKLSKNEKTLEDIFTSFTGSDSTVNKGKQELEDFKNSGLDLQDNIYISVLRKGGGMGSGETAVIAAIGTVKDASKFRAYIAKKQPATEIIKEKAYSYTRSADESMIAWNNELAIAMSYQQKYSGGMEYDSTTGTYNLKKPGSNAGDLKAEMDSYFNLKEDESIASVSEFRDLMQEKADATLWSNTSSFMADVPIPLPKIQELAGNSFTAATLSFDDGKIDVKSKSYYSKELRDILKKYTGPTVDLGLIRSYPSANINGFIAFAFNPQVIDGIIRHLELAGVVDNFLSQSMGTNYTLQDILKAFKGDFALVFSDFNPAAFAAGTDTAKAQSPQSSLRIARFLFNAPVADKTKMNALMDKLVQKGMLVKVNNNYQPSTLLQQMGLQLSIDEKNVLISNDATLLAGYTPGSPQAVVKEDIMNDFKGKSGVFYINIESILGNLPVGHPDSTSTSILSNARATFRDMKAYAENFNGKNVEGHFELRFRNEKENSVTSLLQFVNAVARSAKSNRTIRVDEIHKDRVTPAVLRSREAAL